jgi:hypothetical protein
MLKLSRLTASFLSLCLYFGTAIAGAPGDNSTAGEADSIQASDAAAGPAPTDTQLPELTGFKGEYEVRYLAFTADLKLSLQQLNDGGEYRYEVVTKARGVAKLVRSGTGIERSFFRLTADGLRPQSYHLDDGTEKLENDADIEFDWDNNIAHSVFVGEPMQIELRPGVLDRLTGDVAAIYALRSGTAPSRQEITDGESIDIIEFTPQGRETITVPAGKFETVKYLRQRPGSSRAAMIWYAVDAGYLPAKIEHLKRGKTNITMVAMQLQPGAD